MSDEQKPGIANGTLFLVHMKHGPWWSEMKRGVVLEAKSDGSFGTPMEFSHFGWAQGYFTLTPTVERTKKGMKITLVSSNDRYKRALTVLPYTREQFEADRERRFGPRM
jgi:hypothetical protein